MTGLGRSRARGASVLAAALALAGTGCGAASSSTPPTAAPSASLQVSASVAAPSISPASPTASPVTSVSATIVQSPAPSVVVSGTGGVNATPSPTTTSACTAFAATHVFLHLTGATKNPDGSLTVTGNTATMICGGPDDFHYNFGSNVVTGHVVASATIEVLNAALQDTPITLAKFPAYLATDPNVRVFIYTGPRTAISSLTEQFHP